MGKRMGKIRNLPALQGYFFGSSGKVYGNQNAMAAEVRVLTMDVQRVPCFYRGTND